MPSPFPGMDPYIEATGIWGDFHLSMLAAMRGALNTQLPPRYIAAGDRHVWLQEPETDTIKSLDEPDVFITDVGKGESGKTVGAVLTPPATVILPAVRRQGTRFLKIIDQTDHRVVTVIELLSPSNKAIRADREAYLAKRNEYLGAGINLVEIDLLRKGKRLPLGKPKLPPSDYYVLVCRVAELPKAGVWQVSVRDSLPDIPVPLDPDEADVMLPLRACLDRTYDEGRYVAGLNHHKPLKPPLREEDTSWVRELLAKRSDRPR